MAWTLSAGPRGGILPDVWTRAVRWLANAAPASTRHFTVLSPLKLVLAAHVAAVFLVLQALPDSVVATALSATSLLLTLLVVLALPSDDPLAIPGARAALDEDLGSNHGKLPMPPSGIDRIAPAPELSGLASERHVQRTLQARHDATVLRASAIEGSQAWAALMARISHDIRTPLNAVIGFSDLMQAELFGPLGHARYAEYVDHIRDSGKALLKSAEDTLAMTSLLATDPRPLAGVPLLDIVEDAWSFLAVSAAAKRITLDRPRGLDVELMAERRALRQIMLNLLSEAVERATPGSHIAIGVGIDGCLAQIEIVVPHAIPVASAGEQTLGLSIARVLLELNGTDLVEWCHADGGWRVTTALDLAVQADFFASAS